MRRDFKFGAVIAGVAVLSVGCSYECPVSDETSYTLEIAHTNDIHANVLPLNPKWQPCAEVDMQNNECSGGFARLIGAVKKLREQNSDLLVLDAGDQAQGTLFFQVFKSEPILWLQDKMQYDVLTFGNHEFDEGWGYIEELLANSKANYVSCNLDLSGASRQGAQIKRYTIVTRKGERIGVIGLLTPEAQKLVFATKGINLLDDETAVLRCVSELEEQGVNKIILLSHVGLERDKELAAAVPGIDVIVGGHSHTLLSNDASDADEDYPVFVTSPRNEKVTIVTSGKSARYLGDLLVSFDSNGRVVNASGNSLLLDNRFSEDKTTEKKISTWQRVLAKSYAQAVGEALVDLPNGSEQCRIEECALGNLLTDIMMWWAREQQPDFAIINGGALRKGMVAGPITLGTLNEVLALKSRLATFKLKGSDVRAMLEHSVSRATNKQNDGTGRFLQVSGIRFIWNPEVPEGSRVSDVFVERSKEDYVPLDDQKIYRVVALDYIRKGGDDYNILARNAIEPNDKGILLVDAVLRYLQQNFKVQAQIEGRIRKADGLSIVAP